MSALKIRIAAVFRFQIVLNNSAMFIKSLLFLAMLLFASARSVIAKDNGTEYEFAESSRVLSRRKRFLTFPEGSSLQLVFCVQTAALIPIGDIFLYGNTAALAWNLPSGTELLDDLRGIQRAQRRGDKQDSKMIGYLDEQGRVIAKVPYRRRPIVNPAFAKRSIEEQVSFKEKLKLKIDRMKMHQKQSHRDYLYINDLDKKSINSHRTSRLELFRKIEALLTALGRNGRQCVLYKLCAAAQRSEQGSFMQEFLRTVFTLPKGDDFAEDYHREYDKAHTLTEGCIAKYPGCDLDASSQI